MTTSTFFPPSHVRRFRDRHQAGRLLAGALDHLAGPNTIVLGLPRGGVPVASEVARALHAPLDVLVVRKLGVPFQSEFGMGAIGEGGVRVLNEDTVRQIGITEHDIEAVEARDRIEVERRAARYRNGRAFPSLAGKVVVVVDDGVATGGTARAALQLVKAHGAQRVVLAVPVGSADAIDDLSAIADDVITLLRPPDFGAVGYWYEDFLQTTDEEVLALLAGSDARVGSRVGLTDSEVGVQDGAG